LVYQYVGSAKQPLLHAPNAVFPEKPLKMAKSKLSSTIVPNKKKRSGRKAKTFFVKSIPTDVRLEDFDWDTPVDLDTVIHISKLK
jgi:hypothetical protein